MESNQLYIAPIDGSKWYITKDWILLDEPQTTDLWFKYRQGRCTGSKIGYCVGHATNLSKPDDELEYISGQKEKTFTSIQKKNMAHGVQMEPTARNKHSERIGKVIVELGLTIPLWETRIGSSVDGVVLSSEKLIRPVDQYSPPKLVDLAEGILEIKCPKKLYWPLRQHYDICQARNRARESNSIFLNNNKSISTNNQNGSIFLNSLSSSSKMVYTWKDHFSHIYQNHFDQMQLGMAVLRKPWADYVVHASDGIYTERVPYCHEYFLGELLAPIRNFLDTRLDPILKDGWRSPLSPCMKNLSPLPSSLCMKNH